MRKYSRPEGWEADTATLREISIIRFLHTKTVNKQQRNGAIIFCSFCGGKKGTVLPASGKVENEILKRGNKQKSLSVVTLICILLQ